MVAALAGLLIERLTDGTPDAPAPSPRATGEATPTPTPRPAATPEPSAGEREARGRGPAARGDGELAIGLTELNPALLVPGGPPPFDRWQAQVARMAPAYVRLVVEWGDVARPDGSRLNLATPDGGCMRTVAPCAGYEGFRAQVAALATAQQAAPGRYVGMVVFTHTPAKLAAAPRGCERPGTEPRSRPPRPGALGKYRRLVRAAVAEVRDAGADVPFWSPWNEPNHPYFISPQRAACDASAPSLAVEPYARLATAMLEVLDAEPGDQRLVLGETAGLLEPSPNTTRLSEFVAALPRELVCRAAVYGQHAYVGGTDPVASLDRSLRRRGCPRMPEVWITETGHRDARRPCPAMHRRLKRWYDDPRVTAAFQYTFREDDQFRTGLVTTDLARPLRVLRVWRAWGSRPQPASPPPRVSC